MKETFSLITIFLIVNFTFSQNKDKANIYLNEDFKKIEVDEFKIKKKSYLFFEKIIETDTATLHILKLIEEFNTFSDSSFNNLKATLVKDYKLNLASDKTLIIHYIDTLFGFNEVRKFKNPYYIYRKTNGDTVEIKITPGLYLKQRTSFDEGRKKCEKDAKSLNIEHLYFFKTDFDDSYIYKNVTWYKINQTLIELFPNKKSGILIIKPNGNYYKLFSESYDNLIEAIIRFKDWNLLIDDYNEALITLPKKRKKRLEIKRSTRQRGESFGFSEHASKDEIRSAFEKNALTHPISSPCYTNSY